MSNRTISLTDNLYRYVLDVSLREPDVLRRLRKETANHPESKMQIAPDQGQFMAFLTRLASVRKAIEVGVFTGYSSLAVALALPDDGRLVACDVNEEYTDIARRYWCQAEVEHKIDLRIAPAIETLDDLLRGGEADSFDMGFIDADKVGYNSYYERLLRLMRPGGLILIDNALRGGDVADPSVSNEGTVAIRQLNAKLHTDQRIDLTLVPIGDGLMMALKR